ncbi:hypothetical protein [Cyanobium sp. ATX-6F1]|uniref:hypothetical protein n=1 Tax=Cyanobium sp. ATX-6F1 TaxID=3137388 RepID=UPI0039BE792A
MGWLSVLEPTNLLLLACAVLYGLIGEPTDAVVLLAFVAFISLLDGVQQQRSRKALAALAALSAPRRGCVATETSCGFPWSRCRWAIGCSWTRGIGWRPMGRWWRALV